MNTTTDKDVMTALISGKVYVHCDSTSTRTNIYHIDDDGWLVDEEGEVWSEWPNPHLDDESDYIADTMPALKHYDCSGCIHSMGNTSDPDKQTQCALSIGVTCMVQGYPKHSERSCHECTHYNEYDGDEAGDCSLYEYACSNNLDGNTGSVISFWEEG